jgi:hypothetical protein
MASLNRSYLLSFTAQNGKQIKFGQTIDERGLCIDFIANKTISKEPNVSELTIYNIGQETMNTFQKNGVLTLSAGYQNENYIVINGWSAETEIIPNEKGQTGIKIFVQDGLGISGNLLTKIEFSSKTNSTKIIDGLIQYIKKNMLGISIAPYVIRTPVIYESAISLFGDAYDLLVNYLRDCNHFCFIENGTLYIKAQTGSNSYLNEAAVIISENTGMIGAPKAIKELDANNKEKRGCEFESILNPSMKIGKLAKIVSKNINDVYRIESITHAGNSLDGRWTTKAKGWKIP